MKKIIIALIFLTSLALVGCSINEIKAESLVVTPEEISINVNSELSIHVLVLPSDAKDKTLLWTVADESIATVTQDGILKGISLGKTILTVSVKNLPTVKRDVAVKVIDGSWPETTIYDIYAFNLPKFPTYSSIIVEEKDNHVLLITLAGYGDDETVLSAYFKLLVDEGFIPSPTNDHHIGSYTLDGFNGLIDYHNNSSHGKDTIEIRITPKIDVETSTWQEYNAKVAANIGFLLPDFPQLGEVWIKTNTSNLTIDAVIRGIENLDQSFHTYEDLLEADGWIASSENNHHAGYFIKNYTKLSYHASHEDQRALEIKIDLITTWESVQFEIKKTYRINDLPEFPQYSVLRMKTSTVNGFPSINIEIAGITDVSESFKIYKDLLANIGFTTDVIEDAKTGIFKKDDSLVSFRFIPKAITNSLSLTFTTTGELPHQHNHWDDFQTIVENSFNIALPDFIGAHEVINLTKTDLEFKGEVEIEAPAVRKESILLFMESLILDGWEAKGTPTTHDGTYFKDNYEISYHEDHDDATLVEVKVTKIITE